MFLKITSIKHVTKNGREDLCKRGIPCYKHTNMGKRERVTNFLKIIHNVLYRTTTFQL